MYLIPIAGPRVDAMLLAARDDRPQGLTLGRHESCELLLPANAESVSRFHARIRFDAPTRRWRIADLGSTWGTFLNGVKLAPHAELQLGDGDLLRIEPWTFVPARSLHRRGLTSTDDVGQSMVHTLSTINLSRQTLREEMLALLLEAAAAIHDAGTESELAERLLDSAVRGSGLPNGAVLRPIDAAGRFEMLATRTGGSADDADHFTFSRSLLNAAAQGQTAELSAAGNQSQSMVQMNISAALCVPIMLGPAPAAYLYLDSRAARPGMAAVSSARPNAAAFCAALGRLASMALSSLRRMDIERRQTSIENDLTAAAAAQRWVLPRRQTKVGAFTVIGESRPGRYVGGDFFDVIDLGNGRIAVALGDVSGKGVEASVLMTATQGFLHAALLHHPHPGPAVTAANRFVSPRRPDSRFVTLWTAVIDAVAGTISYVDAGHSYAMLIGAGGDIAELNSGGGPPLGIVDDFEYVAEVVELPAWGRLAVVSDGIVEQPANLATSGGARLDFGMHGAKACFASEAPDAITASDAITPPDEITELFRRLVEHAGSTHLADDATGVCVKWG